MQRHIISYGCRLWSLWWSCQCSLWWLCWCWYVYIVMTYLCGCVTVTKNHHFQAECRRREVRCSLGRLWPSDYNDYVAYDKEVSLVIIMDYDNMDVDCWFLIGTRLWWWIWWNVNVEEQEDSSDDYDENLDFNEETNSDDYVDVNDNDKNVDCWWW